MSSIKSYIIGTVLALAILGLVIYNKKYAPDRPHPTRFSVATPPSSMQGGNSINESSQSVAQTAPDLDQSLNPAPPFPETSVFHHPKHSDVLGLKTLDGKIEYAFYSQVYFQKCGNRRCIVFPSGHMAVDPETSPLPGPPPLSEPRGARP